MSHNAWETTSPTSLHPLTHFSHAIIRYLAAYNDVDDVVSQALLVVSLLTNIFISMSTILPCYASVLLPLAVKGSFTYHLPETLREKVEVGMRVVVQFGAKRYYTGIVVALHSQLPTDMDNNGKLKEVTDIVDQKPLLLPSQLRLWQWIASYYMCSEGEVMKAALPSGLKIESETIVLRNADYNGEEENFSDVECRILSVLDSEKGQTILDIEKKLGERNLLRAVRHLMEHGALVVRESLAHNYRPKTSTYVRLAETFFSEAKLNEVFNAMKRAPQQETLLLRYLQLSEAASAINLGNSEMLLPVSRSMLCAENTSAPAALTALCKRGVLETYMVEESRLKETPDASLTALAGKPLSQEQQRAYEAIGASFKEKEVCLLHGVTSSGKTEVYIQLIKDALARGEQVLYLVPEIALTTQLTERLQRVFGALMGVYHSKFPDAERVEMWQHQLSEKPYPLILGVRSSIFLPYQRLGLVIVDEEHETSYKQQDPAPRYHARDTAIVLAHQLGARVLLGTATPSVETYYNALQGKYALVEMMKRYGNVQLPEVVVEDVKELKRTKQMKTPFSPRLTLEVRKALQAGGQAILFQNRRGYAPVLECRTCGWTPRCTRCDVSLTFHQRLGKLVCHYCGAQYDIPRQCPNCGDTELRDRGYGTEKIEDEAKAVFPEAHTERMDLDTTRTRSAYENIIDRFARGTTNLLIGTQMVTKGLDFDRVKVVGILNADQMLNVADFRAYERAFQMMSQVAGRAGRRGERGLVVVQTRQADNPIIFQVVRADYRAMFDAQIAERRAFAYPPFSRLITIYFKHRNNDVVGHAALHYAALLRPHFGEALLGPDTPVVSRVQLQFIRKIMLKVSPRFTLSSVRQTLLSARDAVQAYPVYKGVTIYFDVD